MRDLLNSDELGMQLRSIRLMRGLTCKQLASKIHISPKTIYAYETGRNGISFEIAIMLAEALNVTLDQLAGRDGTLDLTMRPIREWCKLLGISRQVLSFHCRKHNFNYTEISGRFYIAESEIIKYPKYKKALIESGYKFTTSQGKNK